METIEDILEERDDLGYRSRSEFVIDAIRRRVENLLDNINNLKDDA
jgi:metal-responsive CopG/Arc/MetJ family transcriptional regulator